MASKPGTSPRDKAIMAAVRSSAQGFFRNVFHDAEIDDAHAVLSAVPDFNDRIGYPVAGPRLVGLFYVTLKQGQRANTFQSKGLGPFPSLLTTEPSKPAVIDVQAPNFVFAGNRAKGLVLRIGPAASVAIWHHVQVFKYQSREIVYPVDLGFVLGLQPDEQFNTVEPRLLSLLRHTVKVWCGLEWKAKDDVG